MTAFLWLDIETYSSVDLRKSNVYAYAESPDFEILMCAWSTDGTTVHLAVGEDEVEQIPGLFDPAVIKVAHNAQFERVCLSVLAPDPGYLAPEQFRCTQVAAAEVGLPKGLEKLAKALGAEEKDSAGTRLINLFSKPKRDGTFWHPDEKPDQWMEFQHYCGDDVRTLIDVHKRLPDWPTETERRLWVVDQKINDRGIVVDLDLARAAVEAAEVNRKAQMDEAHWLTGVENPNSTEQLRGWLNLKKGGGLQLPDLKAVTVAAALETVTNPTTKRVLELRQTLSLAASAKYTAAVNSTCADGRFRGGFQFYAAHTGRWGGRRIQLQNLPQSSAAHVEAAILDLLLGNGADDQTLKGLVRSLFLGPLTVVDYSAIEARVLAWLAGEEWVLRAFEEGKEIYVEMAQRMSTAQRTYARKDGKVAVLLLGFHGSIGALRRGGATGTDKELYEIVNSYRAANLRIQRFWYAIGEKFWTGGQVGDHLTIRKEGKDRVIVLPSGRTLTYHDVKRDGGVLSFTSSRGFRERTWDGALTENVTQAVARDVLAEALISLDESGYEIVGHVHDEVIVAGDDLDGVAKHMTLMPGWADGLPLAAKGEVVNRYKKM